MDKVDRRKVVPHPTSTLAKDDRARDRENLARQMRTSQMMREQAREHINPIEILSELKELDLKMQGEQDAAGNDIPMDPDIKKQIDSRIAMRFKLLDKVLPNLKASESVNLTMGEHNINVNQKISNVELAQRLQIWRENHGQGHLMRAESKKTGESCVEATFEEVNDDDQEFDFL